MANKRWSGNACSSATSTSQDIEDKGIHQWLLLGVRGTFVIGDDAEPE